MKYQPKALVLDDTKHWQNIFVEILASLDYTVEAANSYADASHILSTQSFDVAILDIRLSEGDNSNTDGMKVLEYIYDSKEPTSIVIVTGFGTVGLIKDAFTMYKVLDFIEKDRFDEVEFIKSIKHLQESKDN